MKVIQEGNPAAARPWAEQVIIGCGCCGARFRIEPGDTYTEYDDQRDGTGLHVACPCCHSSVDVPRPAWTYTARYGATVDRATTSEAGLVSNVNIRAEGR